MEQEISLGIFIRNSRIAVDLKLTELAEKVGVTVITAYRWEHDLTRPNKTNVPVLAEALQVSPKQLRRR